MKRRKLHTNATSASGYLSVICRALFCFFVFFVVIMPVQANLTLDIKGANKALEENIRAHVGDIDEAEYKNRRLLERRLNSVMTTSAQALGYYHSEWTLSFTSKRVEIFITPGPPILLLKPEISVLGDDKHKSIFADVVENSQLAEGKQLDHAQYDGLKKTLMQKAKRYGFFDAKYQVSELLVNVKDNTAQIKLILEIAERYDFGDVSFEGSQLSDDFMNRMIPFKTGAPYFSEELATFRRDLYATGYFSQVTVTTDNVISDSLHRVNIHVSMEDTSQHHYEVGFGFDTNAGPRVRLSWNMPLVGTKGHSWNSSVEFSEPIQEIVTTYRIPLEQPLTEFLLFETGGKYQKVESTESKLINTGVFRLSIKEDHWQRRYGLSADYERYKQSDDSWDEVFYLVPSISWTRSHVEKGNDPSSGYRLWLSFEAGSKELGSDANFFKGHFGARWLTPLGGSTFRMLARAELGAIDTQDILRVPVSRRFYTGGDQTVRGYEYNTLATRDEDDELLGGRYLNVASLEFSGRIADQWRGAVFADTGRAYIDLDEPFSSSVGIGIRWISVIGVVRVDLAHPLSDESSTPVRLHLSMGPPL